MQAKRLFGTDGIRGVANTYPLTCECVQKIGKALGRILTAQSRGKRCKVLIGRDTRQSGDMIACALVSGLNSCGADVVHLGIMTTPGVAYLTKDSDADAGVVITASHNPFDHNGIKIFSGDGLKLSNEMQARIEELVFEGMVDTSHIPADRVGRLSHRDETDRYVRFAQSTVGNLDLCGMRIIIDCANGAASHMACDVFRGLGADVLSFFAEPDGRNINHECGATHPERIAELVLAHGADIGITLDGDADRVMLCDENGRIVDGDRILAMCALHLKASGKLSNGKVVATVMSNLGLDSAMRKAGIDVVRTVVGDHNVMLEMLRGNHCLGGEQSGHIIFLEHCCTGDGIISALQVIRIMKERGKALSLLAGCMSVFPQVLLNVEVSEKRDFEGMLSVVEKKKEIEDALGDEGRVLLRYSGTESLARVMIEGRDQEMIGAYARELASRIEDEVGICRR